MKGTPAEDAEIRGGLAKQRGQTRDTCPQADEGVREAWFRGYDAALGPRDVLLSLQQHPVLLWALANQIERYVAGPWELREVPSGKDSATPMKQTWRRARAGSPNSRLAWVEQDITRAQMKVASWRWKGPNKTGWVDTREEAQRLADLDLFDNGYVTA